jgi:hypothetical protein
MYNCHVYINHTHSTKLNARSTNEMPIVPNAYSGKQKTYLFQLHVVSVVQGCLLSTAWFPSLVLPMTKSVFLNTLFSPFAPFAVLCHCWSTASLARPIASWFQGPVVLFLFLFNSEIVCELGGAGGGEESERKGTYSACSEEEAIMESNKLKIWSDLKGKVVLVASAVQDLGFALSLSLAKRNCRIVLAGDAAQTRSVSQQIKSALAISSHGTVSEVSLIPPVFFYCLSLGRLHFSCVPEFKVFNKKTPVSFFEKGGSRKIVLQKGGCRT